MTTQLQNQVTLIKTTQPSTVSKSFSVDEAGNITKKAVANITRGRAKSVDVATAEDMAALLEKVSSSTELALCSGIWRGAGRCKSFALWTQSELAKKAAKPQHEITELVASGDDMHGARIKAMVEPSSWVLLDCDTPPHMPGDMARLTLAERLEALELVLPGISTCERVEMRSSSSRVTLVNEPAGERSHAWIRISDPSKLDVLRAYLRVHTVIEGLHYEQPNFSRVTGKQIGSSARTLIDLAVIDRARLTFVAKPVVDPEAWELETHDPGVRIINDGAGVLDLSEIELPDAQAVWVMNEARGTNETLKTDNGMFIFEDTDTLKDDTPVIVKGEEKPLSEWVEQMREDGVTKMRCEAPFRESHSEAGILRVTDRNEVLIHDVGNNTNYKLSIDLSEMFGGADAEDTPVTTDASDAAGSEDAQDNVDSDKDGKASKAAVRLAKRVTIAINKSLSNGKAYDESEDGVIDESEEENESVVCDPRVVEKILSNTFYFASGSSFLFCNNKHQLVEYSRTDVWGALVETFGAPVNPAKLYKETKAAIGRMGGDSTPSAATINKFEKGVRDLAQSLVLSHIKLYQQRKSMAIAVDMFEKKARMELSSDDVTVVFPHERLQCKTPMANVDAIEDYKKHFPDLDEFLDFIASARFASGRKKAHLWIKATSDWGKDLLMDALGGLGIVVKLNEKEVESAIEGKPVGKDANSFKRALIAHFNEFKTIKSELKQLENGLTISPKHQMMQTVPLYGKVFTSAEDVSGLVTENGVENQFANRFCVFVAKGSIEDRPMFAKLGGGVYLQSIQRYVCDELNRRIADYIKMGRMGAVKQADEDLKAFVERHSIKNLYDTLDEQIDSVAEDFALWVRDGFDKVSPEDDAFVPADSQGLVLNDHGTRGRVLSQFCHVLGTPDKPFVLLTKPNKVVNDWLREMYHGPDYFVMRFKAKMIIESLGGLSVVKDANRKSRKGLKFEF